MVSDTGQKLAEIETLICAYRLIG